MGGGERNWALNPEHQYLLNKATPYMKIELEYLIEFSPF